MSTIELEVRERRQAIRQKTIGPASIGFRDGNCSMDCVVLDLSDYGAKIQPTDVTVCPDRFTLATKDGGRFDCLVVWRHDERVGVKFLL